MEETNKSKLPIIICVLLLIIGVFGLGIFVGSKYVKGKDKCEIIVNDKTNEEEDNEDEEKISSKSIGTIKKLEEGDVAIQYHYLDYGGPQEMWDNLKGPSYISTNDTEGNCNKTNGECSEVIKYDNFTFKYDGNKKYINNKEIPFNFDIMSSIIINDEEYLIFREGSVSQAPGYSFYITDLKLNVFLKSDLGLIRLFRVKNSDGIFDLYVEANDYDHFDEGEKFYIVDFENSKMVESTKPSNLKDEDTLFDVWTFLGEKLKYVEKK